MLCSISWQCVDRTLFYCFFTHFPLISLAEFSPIYVDNLNFLADYFGVALAVPVQVQTTIRERLRETPGLPLSALAYDGSGVRPNDVYAMLALRLLYTDLYAAPLIQHGRVRLYLNAEQARTHAHLLPTRRLPSIPRSCGMGAPSRSSILETPRPPCCQRKGPRSRSPLASSSTCSIPG